MGPVMKRKEGWELKLDGALQQASAAPYILGETDCFAGTSDIVMQMTDTDIMEKWRGKYQTFLQAARVIKREDYDGVPDWLDQVTQGRIKPKQAQRGDIVARHINRVMPSLGICAGDQALIFTHDEGAIYVPMRKIEAAWRV